MERLYCSRCLKAHHNTSSQHCPQTECKAPRPEEGWPAFRGEDEIIGGRFRVLRLVGSGGAGLTYQCIDRDREEIVALKVLHPDRRYGMLAQRMALEGQLLELLDHPGIVPFRGIQIVGPGPAWLATSFLPGGTLADQVRGSGPLPLPAVAALAVQLGEALDYIHRSGVVHRDIKPANLLFESTDLSRLKVQIADFGIARLFGNAGIPMGVPLTQSGLFVGTPEYAAPEQMRGERDVGAGADKFALGAVLHFAATGESLFKFSSQAGWIRRRGAAWLPSQRSRIASEVSAEPRDLAHTLDRLIDDLMAPEPSERLSLGILLESLAAHSQPESSAAVEISRTLCEVPEPEQMQAMAKLWSKSPPLDMAPSAEPVVGVTRVEVPLPELLRDSWTTGLANHNEVLPPAETPLRISESVVPQRPKGHIPVEVEVDWLPRATRRRRALIRALAAVLVLSLGLEFQELRSEGYSPGIRTVLAEASAWLESSSGLLKITETRQLEEARAGAVLVAASQSPPAATNRTTRSTSTFGRTGKQSNGRRGSATGIPVRKTTGTLSSATHALPIPMPQALKKGVPKIVVGSDDVWGVKSYRARNIGDALAYNSEDEVVLERIFGDN